MQRYLKEGFEIWKGNGYIWRQDYKYIWLDKHKLITYTQHINIKLLKTTYLFSSSLHNHITSLQHCTGHCRTPLLHGLCLLQVCGMPVHAWCPYFTVIIQWCHLWVKYDPVLFFQTQVAAPGWRSICCSSVYDSPLHWKLSIVFLQLPNAFAQHCACSVVCNLK